MKIRKSGGDSTIDCSHCHRPNPVELIYCAALDCAAVDCAAVLHPGRTACDACRAAIPVNARFCPDCGQATRYGKEAEVFNAEGIRSGRAKD